MNLSERGSHRVLVLALLWIAYLLNYVDRQMVFTWFPVLRQDAGFSNSQLGLIGTVFLWSYSACAPFGGRVCDRFPRGVVITLSIAGWSLATIGTGLSWSPASFLFWRGVVGVTEGFYFPAAVSMLVEVFGNALRGRVIALHGMAQFAGIALGGWLGGFAADKWGWRMACYTLGGCGLIYSLVAGRMLHGMQNARQESRRYSLRSIRVTPCLLGISGCFFLICAMLWMLYAWLPDAIHSRFALSLTASGVNATLVLQVSSMAGLLSGGALGDWARQRRVAARGFLIAAGLLCTAPFAWLCFAAASLEVLWIAEAGFGIFSAIMLSNVIAGAYDLVPESQHGIIAGLITLVGGLGGGLAMLAAGVWIAHTPPEVMMLWMAMASAIAGVLLAVLVNRKFAEEVRSA
jgi:MFS family permease